jgi:putative membrane protein
VKGNVVGAVTESKNDSSTETVDRRWPRSLYSVGTDPDPRFSLANERTFLAWVRSALALIGLGVALHTIAPAFRGAELGRGYAVGAATLGTLCALESFRRWYVNERAMRSRRPLGGGRSSFFLVLVLAVVGVVVVGSMWLR